MGKYLSSVVAKTAIVKLKAFTDSLISLIYGCWSWAGFVLPRQQGGHCLSKPRHPFLAGEWVKVEPPQAGKEITHVCHGCWFSAPTSKYQKG
jgi:hypothetical protein